MQLTKNFSNEFIEDHVRWRNQALPWTRTNKPTNYKEQSRFLDNPKPNMEFFAIEVDTHVGTCGLTDIDKDHKTAEFSLLIDPNHQRKGYGTQALKMLLEYGFGTLKLHTIFGETFAYPLEAQEYLDSHEIQYIEMHDRLVNPGAKAYEKLGFILEGTMRQRYRKYRFPITSLYYAIHQ